MLCNNVYLSRDKFIKWGKMLNLMTSDDFYASNLNTVWSQISHHNSSINRFMFFILILTKQRKRFDVNDTSKFEWTAFLLYKEFIQRTSHKFMVFIRLTCSWLENCANATLLTYSLTYLLTFVYLIQLIGNTRSQYKWTATERWRRCVRWITFLGWSRRSGMGRG